MIALFLKKARLASSWLSVLAPVQSLLSLYGCRVFCYKLSWFGHVYHNDMLPKIILQGTADDSRRTGIPRKSWKDNTEIDRPVTVVVAPNQREQKLMGNNHHSGGVCPSTPTTHGRHGSVYNGYCCSIIVLRNKDMNTSHSLVTIYVHKRRKKITTIVAGTNTNNG